MGNIPQSLPNLSFNIKSDCCNGKEGDSDEGDMVRSKKPSWFRRSFKSDEGGETIQKENKELAKRSARVQFAQTDEEAVPNTEISS